MADDLTKLGADGFESLSQALAVSVLGAGVRVFGDGPDGGREATFEGRVPFPSQAEQWDGYGVLQAKYKATVGTTRENKSWFLGQVKAEMDAWTDPTKRRVIDGRLPQYLIFTTNVALSSAPRTGGKDAFEELMRGYQAGLPLVGWRVWDADQISSLLDGYPDVRRAYAGLITPSEVLAMIMERFTRPIVVNVQQAAPVVMAAAPLRVRIKPGQPGNERPFQESYDAAGGVELLGEPESEVDEIGDGFMQRLDGGRTGMARVMCAPLRYPVVVMDQAVWDQLESIGGRHGGVRCIGYPVLNEPGRPYIGTDWDHITLVGGQWGRLHNDVRRGRLVRDKDGRPLWQTEIIFDSEACRTQDWRVDHSREAKMDLRLAVSGSIPLLPDDLRVTEKGRRRLLQSVADGGLDDLIRALSQRYGSDPTTIDWQEVEDPYRNTGRNATYEYLLAGPTGRTAIRGGLQLGLPASHSTEVTVLADVRIDFDAIQPRQTAGHPVPVSADLALRLDDLIAFFRSGWQVATTSLLLAATEDPQRIQPAGAPRIELYIQNERPENTGDSRPRRLLDMVDLSAFGRARIQDPRSLAVGVTTPIGLTSPEIRRRVRDAMERMGEDFGFTNPVVPM